MTREQEKKIIITEEYLANAKAILLFCLASGLSESQCLKFSKLPIEFADFQKIYNNYPDIEEFEQYMMNRADYVERNRQFTMHYGA